MVTALILLASATSAIHAQAAPDAQRATNASDARDAKGERDASSKSGAAAKRQAKTAAKASDDVANAADAKSDDAAKSDGNAAAKDEVKMLSGISILGNQEAPKSLVIVPWKSSEIGDMPGLSRLLDDSVQPIDKEVFMRELDYYEIRSSSR
jgi:hypothetical protein